jgi:hypothetical protein
MERRMLNESHGGNPQDEWRSVSASMTFALVCGTLRPDAAINAMVKDGRLRLRERTRVEP